MSTGKAFAFVALGGVGLYLLYRTFRVQGGALADALSLFDPFFGPSTPGFGQMSGYQPSTGPGNEPIQQSKPIAPAIAGVVGAITAGGSGSSGSDGGISGKGAAIAGAAAGAGLLVWGIVTQGWFRGGEEGIYVNPNRDEFLANFEHFDPYRDQNNPSGFYGLAWLLNEMGAENGPLAQIGRAYGDRLFAALTRADTKEEFNAARDAIMNYLRTYPARVQELERYAVAHFPLAA